MENRKSLPIFRVLCLLERFLVRQKLRDLADVFTRPLYVLGGVTLGFMQPLPKESLQSHLVSVPRFVLNKLDATSFQCDECNATYPRGQARQHIAAQHPRVRELLYFPRYVHLLRGQM